MRRPVLALALAALALAGCKLRGAPAGGPFRLGYFPNVTHAQALVGVADGTLSRALEGRLVSRVFNAGPAAMEALVAGDLEATYVGPGPAAIAFLRTHGEAIRVIAGAASGGAVLVVKDARTAADLAGKRVASPQLGNTQDVALRTWLRANGLAAGDGPGQVNVTPLSNPDILSLFARGELAGAWVPEPWGARLVAEAGGRILVDERTLWPDGRFPITVLAVSVRALEARRAEILALLRAHVELTRRWQRDRDAFAAAANAAYATLAGKPLPSHVLADAFSRLEPLADPLAPQLAELARRAQALGFAPAGDVSGIVDGRPLQELAER
ncbi:ABC transporter substrate-binding protein [Anaeromyxobacter oryzae]|uniref:Sulfonate ABC transporter substrate-binding protein n=1 Tax=Anaeromyxobacter oryzae TaxID=2918170 RepID=A0ABM7WX47_9BACT|nr:ABC transporter substrate-binding protein [Anaeromyxobacter oryzae]BDG04015.1 sulfonate ABC transporter substrate-binding protein [Anaeromyxobacter oryzae]